MRIYFLENFINPRSLKDIASEKSFIINPAMDNDKTIVITGTTSIDNTFSLESTDHGRKEIFIFNPFMIVVFILDQSGDGEESYMSTTNSLSFLTDVFNNIKLEGS